MEIFGVFLSSKMSILSGKPRLYDVVELAAGQVGVVGAQLPQTS